MKHIGGGGIAPTFLTSALEGGEWSASRPGRFTPMERAPGTHWIGGGVGPQSRSGNGGEEKNSQPLLGLEPPIIHSPALYHWPIPHLKSEAISKNIS
jgi:hypothetical protein